jgi:hypothetical protein
VFFDLASQGVPGFPNGSADPDHREGPRARELVGPGPPQLQLRLHVADDQQHRTLMLAVGEHPKIVSERLGHATVGVTLDTYSHVLPGLQAAAADRLAETLSGAGRAGTADPRESANVDRN